MQEIFESTLDKLLSDNLSPELLSQAEEQGWAAPLWELLEESGFALAAVSEEHGGAGARWSELCGVIQLCGRHALPLPLPEAILANWLLGASGIDGLSGSLSFCAKNDLQWHGEQLFGTAFQVPWGRDVDHVLAIVHSDHPSVVVLNTDSAERTESTNLAGEPRDDLMFKALEPNNVAALPPAMDSDVLLYGGAMLRSAQIAGALERLIAASSLYTNERVQFGKPIGKFQAVQHQLAVLAEHVAAARVASQAAFAESGDVLACRAVMAAKISASEAASIGTSAGHGVHGAIGFTKEYDLHPLTRRLWAWRSEYGSVSYWSTILGRAVCAAGADQFWPTITNGDFR